MFAFNFVFWMFGALLIGIGTYAAIENWKQGQGNSKFNSIICITYYKC